MDRRRAKIIAWVGSEVLPHEAELRGFLRRSLSSAQEADDVIQEAYCRISGLDDVGHIANARAYLFQTARNIVLEQVRRAQIVRIETMTEMDNLSIVLDEPSPERIAAGRRELARVMGLIAALPERCRRVVELRKIEGLSQKEIARRLGVSEHVVENEATRGLRLVLKALTEADDAAERAAESVTSDERTRDRKSDR